ncbi:MAG TPA: FHA domain-containing protein [Candidatus Eisenbergiella stercorigallinarum]|uniref:FHA domain-containing protein n=1 Tax=Candidatus Eisenbergiella stercorigallinarum TaxID=2838557 RepID=A0A9D2QY81_9FIRM|nr:FHA domain-containing protein [Candidatus Eisenbergiella stercorigallinarum]
MGDMWRKKNLAEKILLIGIVVHFLGFFIIPSAELSASAELLSRLASAFGVDEMPKQLTRFAYLRIAMKESAILALITFGIFPVLDGLCLWLAAKNGGRKRYIVTLLIYLLAVAPWSRVTVQMALDTTGYEMCAGSMGLVFLPLLLAALSLLCFLLYGKLRARTAEGAKGIHMDQVKKGAADALESIKNQDWEGRAETAKAVASYAGKRAAGLAQKLAEGGKEIVRQAKEEQAGGQPDAAPQKEEKQAARPPQTGTLTGRKGMYAGAQIPLPNGERIVIGRDASRSSIVLADKTVSGAHCIVCYDAGSGKYQVTDCSENGTALENGMRLPKNRTVMLEAGQVLVIGSEQFRLG